MCSYESNPNHLVFVIYSYNKPVMISFYIKYNSVIANNACRFELFFNILEITPLSFLASSCQAFKGCSASGYFSQKFLRVLLAIIRILVYKYRACYQIGSISWREYTAFFPGIYYAVSLAAMSQLLH